MTALSLCNLVYSVDLLLLQNKVMPVLYIDVFIVRDKEKVLMSNANICNVSER